MAEGPRSALRARGGRAAGRSTALALLLAIGLIGGGAACSGGGSPAESDGGVVVGCPNDLPATCPDPPPSFDGSVFGIIEHRCAICHKPGGQSSEKPMTSYRQIAALRGPMLDQVYACKMPPDGGIGQPLSGVERLELLGWLVCGAPEN